MEILKWLSRAAGSLAQNVSVGTPTVSVGLPTCILRIDGVFAHTGFPRTLDFRAL